MNIYAIVGNKCVNETDAFGLISPADFDIAGPGRIFALAAWFSTQGDLLGAKGILWYYFGHGIKMTLTRNELKSISLDDEGIDVLRFPRMSDARFSVSAGRESKVKVNYDEQQFTVGGINGNNLLGTFTIIIKNAEVSCDSDARWKAIGDFIVKDEYNFDPKIAEYFQGKLTRKPLGELKTILGAIYLPGHSYDIDSDLMRFTQNGKDNYSNW